MPPQITSYGRPIAIISCIGSVVAAGHSVFSLTRPRTLKSAAPAEAQAISFAVAEMQSPSTSWPPPAPASPGWSPVRLRPQTVLVGMPPLFLSSPEPKTRETWMIRSVPAGHWIALGRKLASSIFRALKVAPCSSQSKAR